MGATIRCLQRCYDCAPFICFGWEFVEHVLAIVLGGICIVKVNFEKRIERFCRQNRFSAYIVMLKSKKLLEQYRNAPCTFGYNAQEEKEIVRRFKLLANQKYRQTYVAKCGEKTGSIDYMLLEIMGTKWAMEIVAKVFNVMKTFDDNGPDYVFIIDKYYMAENPSDDVDVQVELEITRSYYYRMKKAAITLFGILLWNTMIDEVIEKSA